MFKTAEGHADFRQKGALPQAVGGGGGGVRGNALHQILWIPRLVVNTTICLVGASRFIPHPDIRTW